MLRELVDHKWDEGKGTGVGTIDKWDYENNKLVNLLTADGTLSNNSTKGTPVLQADLFGDWREEIIWRTEDSSALRVYMTTKETEHRIYTLMHDPQYRLAIAWQNVGYNQPPHPSFFLGHDMAKPPVPSIDLVEKPDVIVPETDAEVIGEEKNEWFRSPVTVNFTAYDWETGIDATYYSLNGSAKQQGATLVITEDGKHGLEYWSVDKAGNIETKKSLSISIDQTAPVITFSVVDGALFGVDQQIRITCEASDPLSGVASTTCEEISVPAYELGLGSHTFKVDAADHAGNSSDKSVNVIVTVNYDSLGILTEQFLTEAGGKSNILNSLFSKLESAKAAEEKGNKNARNGHLGAYINEVKAKNNKDFTGKQVQVLIQLAESLMK